MSERASTKGRDHELASASIRPEPKKGKRWTEEEDRFIHAYFEAVGDYLGPHDLGRPAGAAAKRADVLKRSGAWDALDREVRAKRDYRKAVGVKFVDDDSEYPEGSHLAALRLARDYVAGCLEYQVQEAESYKGYTRLYEKYMRRVVPIRSDLAAIDAALKGSGRNRADATPNPLSEGRERS